MSALKEKWTMETGWVQEPTTEVPHAEEEHPMEATVQKGQLRRSSWGLGDGSPPSWQLHCYPVPGLCVGRWPRNANMTHSRHGQHELARIPNTVPTLVVHVHVCQKWEDRWYPNVEPNHRFWHKINLSTSPEHPEVTQCKSCAGVVLCIICSPCFWASTKRSKASWTVLPNYVFCT